MLKFNDLDLCISENETLKHLINETFTPESTVTSGQMRSSTQSPQLLEDPGPINISVTITLTLDPLKPFGGYSRNITHLSATIFGHQIGLSGKSTEISRIFVCVNDPLFNLVIAFYIISYLLPNITCRRINVDLIYNDIFKFCLLYA